MVPMPPHLCDPSGQLAHDPPSRQIPLSFGLYRFSELAIRAAIVRELHVATTSPRRVTVLASARNIGRGGRSGMYPLAFASARASSIVSPWPSNFAAL